jgi:hypothetical protein
VLALGVLAVGVVASGSLLLPPRQTGQVAVPPPGAAPEQVVAAYLAALGEHDCATARALLVADAAQGGTWCAGVARVTEVEVGRHVAEPPAAAGPPASKAVVTVPVRFHLDWRVLHDDGSLADGLVTWGYRLALDPAAGWRIVDEGAA